MRPSLSLPMACLCIYVMCVMVDTVKLKLFASRR